MPPHSSGLSHEDLAACRVLLKQGSKSFYAASRLLPRRVRDWATVLYAFCRVADDRIDDGVDAHGVEELTLRVRGVYTKSSWNDPVDRALAVVVREASLPESVFHLMIEGFSWDREGKVYEEISDTVAYSVRVASTVGVLMAAIMGVRDRENLGRASDLGIAMQLTNIARDVGEDGRNQRVYLPDSWLVEEGLSREDLMGSPVFDARVGRVVRRLLDLADVYYRRADSGIAALPRGVRVSIRSASLIYQAIGKVISANHYDSISRRAWTSKARKLWLLCRATGSLFWRVQPECMELEPEAKSLLYAFETEGRGGL
jgi:phytoene synthase